MTSAEKFLSTHPIVDESLEEKTCFKKVEDFLGDVQATVEEILDKIDHWQFKRDFKSPVLPSEVDKFEQVDVAGDCWKATAHAQTINPIWCFILDVLKIQSWVSSQFFFFFFLVDCPKIRKNTKIISSLQSKIFQ